MISSHDSHVPHGVTPPLQFVSVPFRLMKLLSRVSVTGFHSSVTVPPGATGS